MLDLVSTGICENPKPSKYTFQNLNFNFTSWSHSSINNTCDITIVELEGCDLIDLCVVIDSSGSIRDNNPSDGSYDNWELTLAFVREVCSNRFGYIMNG